LWRWVEAEGEELLLCMASTMRFTNYTHCHTVGTLYTPSHGWHIIYTITQFTHYSHGHTVHALYTPSRGSHIIHTVMLGLLCLGNTWTFMLGKYLDFALCDNRPHSWYKTKSVLSFLKNKKTKINV
jgi:hypothetical protein